MATSVHKLKSKNTLFFPVPVEEELEQQQRQRLQRLHRQQYRQRRAHHTKVNEQYQLTAAIIYEPLPDVLEQNAQPRSDLNISDVLEAISLADPSFEPADGAGGCAVVLEGAMERAPPPHGGPYVRIVEQPASKALRFRYECEGRSAGSIPGVNSTADHKTYPTIEIVDYVGKAIIFVSCVTRDHPHKPHPHNLVGRDRCDKGVCTQKVDVTQENNRFAFANLGIQCVKRRDIADALRVREDLRVDPFRTGYAHRNQPQSIDLNAVRLCFQVFITGEGGRMRHSLPPVVSEVIYDKKAMSDLQILRISSSSGSVRGGADLILLCEKVTREDISVVFYEERRVEGAGNGGASAVVWEEPANIVMVHKQYAIAFTAPPYRDPAASGHVEVFVQLKRPTDNARSVGIPFTYYPEYQETDYIRGKRKKLPLSHRPSIIAQIEQESAKWQEQKTIKSEPSDKSPLHMGSPHQNYPPIDRPWLGNPLATLETGAGGGGALGGAYAAYGAELHWPPNTYQTLPPAMQVGALSPGAHSPHNLPAASPALQHHMQAMQQVMSPQHQQVLSPHHQQVMSPQHQQVMSPQHQQVMSPQHQQVMSPQHQQQVMSPQQQVMSPHMAMSPQGHMLDERGATMGHVSPNMGHVSPNLMQQQVQQVQQLPQHVPQPMETNSTPSLSRLLEGEDNIQLNSGDLSTLSAMLGQPLY